MPRRWRPWLRRVQEDCAELRARQAPRCLFCRGPLWEKCAGYCSEDCAGAARAAREAARLRNREPARLRSAAYRARQRQKKES